MLLEKIENDIKLAMKEKNEDQLRTLRMVKADLMYEKTKTGKDLSEDKVLEIVNRAAKKRKEPIVEFNKGNRPDLAEKEVKELEIIELYLPKQLSEEEIVTIIDQKLSSMESIKSSDFGKIMGLLSKELKGQADGNLISKILKEKLAGK